MGADGWSRSQFLVTENDLIGREAVVVRCLMVPAEESIDDVQPSKVLLIAQNFLEDVDQDRLGLARAPNEPLSPSRGHY